MTNHWRGIHLIVRHDPEVDRLIEALPSLAEMGLNVLVPEINYQFAYRSHPELQGDDPITSKRAKALVEACRAHDIRLILQFQCLGHQSWAETTMPLLQAYPEFDETPGQYPSNEGIYCRSWCPQHPDVNPIIFALFDELLETFEADALHVGMDEVFLIGSEHCPRCADQDPAELFAMAVNDYYDFLSKRHVEMLMWGDRLLNAEETGYGKWEAAENGTDPAIDMIPTDIVICDWHYEVLDDYPSIPIFLGKGFPTWPAGWKNVEATRALLEATLAHAEDLNLLGYLCTTWGAVAPDELAQWPPIQLAMEALS
ncbi:MAG: family 20 glycosylhydrolase [Anaerolineae bacterium]